VTVEELATTKELATVMAIKGDGAERRMSGATAEERWRSNGETHCITDIEKFPSLWKTISVSIYEKSFL